MLGTLQVLTGAASEKNPTYSAERPKPTGVLGKSCLADPDLESWVALIPSFLYQVSQGLGNLISTSCQAPGWSLRPIRAPETS